MKKKILYLFFLAYSGVAHSQDCGTWVIDTTYCESWVNIDTINYNPKADTTWTYTEWKFTINPANIYSPYCSCGCGNADWEIRKRVSLVGIIQQQKRVTTYKYIETEFEKRLRLLKNKKE